MTVKELKRMLQYVSDDTNIMISEFDEYGDPIWIPKVEPEPDPTTIWQGGKLQELLYLDPEPDGRPIRLRPTRQAIYEAWLAEKRARKEEDESCL